MRTPTIVLALTLLMFGCAPGGGPYAVPGGEVKNASTPEELVRAYYAAIDRGNLRAAYSAWGRGGEASGLTYEQFAEENSPTERAVMEIVGPIRIEAAAGSSYATVPVVVRVDSKDGKRRNYTGQVVVRRANDIPGATPEQLRWHIDSADVREIR